jgi:hypothetical protein
MKSADGNRGGRNSSVPVSRCMLIRNRCGVRHVPVAHRDP